MLLFLDRTCLQRVILTSSSTSCTVMAGAQTHGAAAVAVMSLTGQSIWVTTSKLSRAARALPWLHKRSYHGRSSWKHFRNILPTSKLCSSSWPTAATAKANDYAMALVVPHLHLGHCHCLHLGELF